MCFSFQPKTGGHCEVLTVCALNQYEVIFPFFLHASDLSEYDLGKIAMLSAFISLVKLELSGSTRNR